MRSLRLLPIRVEFSGVTSKLPPAGVGQRNATVSENDETREETGADDRQVALNASLEVEYEPHWVSWRLA
jgi:hypothetical protein